MSDMVLRVFNFKVDYLKSGYTDYQNFSMTKYNFSDCYDVTDGGVLVIYTEPSHTIYASGQWLRVY